MEIRLCPANCATEIVPFPVRDLVRMYFKLFSELYSRLVPFEGCQDHL